MGFVVVVVVEGRGVTSLASAVKAKKSRELTDGARYWLPSCDMLSSSGTPSIGFPGTVVLGC